MSAAAGGTMCFWWWRMEEDDRQRVWLLYGWFTMLMCCGSCFGAVDATARMQGIAALAPVNLPQLLKDLSNAEIWSLRSLNYRWEAV